MEYTMDVRIKSNTIQNQYVAESIALTTSLAASDSASAETLDRLIGVLEQSVKGLGSLSDNEQRQILDAARNIRRAKDENAEHEVRQSAVLEFLTLLRESFGEVADVVLTAANLTKVLW